MECSSSNAKKIFTVQKKSIIKAGAEPRNSCTCLFKNGGIMLDILPDLLFSDTTFFSHNGMC